MDNLFYDGFNSKLIETAFFDGMLEIPILNPQNDVIVPTVAVPFSKRKNIVEDTEMLVFYEQDPVFRDFVSVPQKYVIDF